MRGGGSGEAEEAFGPSPPAAASGAAEVAAEIFACLDRNDDGHVTMAELVRASRGGEGFARSDEIRAFFELGYVRQENESTG